tara:strand:+ start:544 stop:1296 length:753 start_codon:yes stop_codon:yes gene_type:complete
MKLYNGDCLEVMKSIPEKSIDAIITDPPYGTTACKWDSVIPFDLMWEQLNRIIKDNGAIVLFGSEPFSSALRMSNIKNYKYDWIWIKTQATGFLNAKKMPLKQCEIISVFYNKLPTYNPQLKNKKPENIRKLYKNTKFKESENYGKYKRSDDFRIIPIDKTYPTNVLNFKNSNIKKKIHPTQKPVKLMGYLIKTYTNEFETVLDFTMGSGTTGVACCNLNRDFIGIELDKHYFKIAEQRIKQQMVQTKLF